MADEIGGGKTMRSQRANLEVPYIPLLPQIDRGAPKPVSGRLLDLLAYAEVAIALEESLQSPAGKKLPSPGVVVADG